MKEQKEETKRKEEVEVEGKKKRRYQMSCRFPSDPALSLIQMQACLPG